MMRRWKQLTAAIGAATFLSAAPMADLPEPRLAIANPGETLADLLGCLHGKTTLVSAHRGGPTAGYPESALETFARSLSRNPVLFETDIHTAADGTLLVMHDDTLDRTSTGHGLIGEQSWAALSLLRLKDTDGKVTGFAIPKLETVLEWIRGRGLIVLDMKEGVETTAVAALVKRMHAEPYAGVIAYSPAQAKAFHDADPDITIVYPIDKAEDFAALRDAGVPDNRVMAWMGITGRHVALWRYARAHGMPIAYGTLFFGDYAMTMTGNYAHFAELARDGVDVLPTDYPEIAFSQIAKVHDTDAALRACRAVKR